jgi:hypothetical protein
VIDSATSRDSAQMIKFCSSRKGNGGETIRREVVINGSEGRILATSMSKTSRLQEPYLRS